MKLGEMSLGTVQHASPAALFPLMGLPGHSQSMGWQSTSCEAAVKSCTQAHHMPFLRMLLCAAACFSA